MSSGNEALRRKIITAALPLVGQLGPANVTVRRICAEAGISVGSFYNGFSSLDELLGELDLLSGSSFPVHSPEDLRAQTAEGKLLEFAGHYIRALLDTGWEDHLALSRSYPGALGDEDRPVCRLVEEIVRRGQETGELTRQLDEKHIRQMFFITLRGCSQYWCAARGQYDLERETLLHLRILLHGLRRVL